MPMLSYSAQAFTGDTGNCVDLTTLGVATALSDLALLYMRQGKYSDAEPLSSADLRYGKECVDLTIPV